MKRFLFGLLLCLPLSLCHAAEPGNQIDALLADLNTRQLANIPPSVATITVTPGQAEVYEPITATLDADIPADSRVYGNGWKCSARVRMLPVSTTVQHIWAAPGKHTIGYTGVWVHTRTIVIVDKNGDDQTIESLLGIGMIDSSASFTVGDGPEPPDPPDPPIPPPPGPLAEMWVIVVEDRSTRTPAQAWVLLDPTVREWMATNEHHYRILAKSQPASDLTEWIERAVEKDTEAAAEKPAVVDSLGEVIVPAGSALPYLFVVDDLGVVSFEGPLPIGPIQMLELVKKWGMEQ